MEVDEQERTVTWRNYFCRCCRTTAGKDSWCAALHIPLLTLSYWTLEPDSHRILLYGPNYLCRGGCIHVNFSLPRGSRRLMLYLLSHARTPLCMTITHLHDGMFTVDICNWTFVCLHSMEMRLSKRVWNTFAMAYLRLRIYGSAFTIARLRKHVCGIAFVIMSLRWCIYRGV